MDRRTISSAAALLLVVAAATAAAPAPAAATSCVTGSIAAESSDRPDLGAYVYRITIWWGPLQFGLSHWDLLLGHMLCDPLCLGESPFAFAEIAGTSREGHGDGECTVSYGGALACNGDPSIGYAGPLVKYEPLPEQECEPGKSGWGVFTFYTDWPPGPVGAWSDVLAVKFGHADPCFGPLTGTLPVCGGHPTATERTTWGGLKGLYR